MNVKGLNKQPTAYEELTFFDRIYKTENELRARLRETGYKKYKDINVPKVDCFIYVPSGFPTSASQAFNFAALRHRRITVGVCIGGTTMLNGWDAKLELGMKGMLENAHNNDNADLTASQILQALEDFCDAYPELSMHCITLDIAICGYSLGGLFAQATTVLLQNWAEQTANRVKCRTFDGPGTPEAYHEAAREYGPVRGSYWNQTITNYKSFPSPLNTVFEDIGRVFHLKNAELFETDWRWTMRCFASTTHHVASLSDSFFSSTSTKQDTSSDAKDAERYEEDKEKEKRQKSRKMINDAVWAFAKLADIGMDVNEIVRNHDVVTMMGCFDEETGETLPGASVEMRQWPTYRSFNWTPDTCVVAGAQTLLNRWFGSTPNPLLDPEEPGVSNILLYGGKRRYLEDKLAKMPGYVPL